MKVLILSGGIGTGLWPLSREEYPKQFLDIMGGKSLLQLTVERFLPAVSPEDIFIVTQKDKKFLIERELAPYGFQETQIICEPFMRGTAFAVFLGVTCLREKIGVHDDESICVAPSDHYIGNEKAFCSVLKKLENLPGGYYTLLGVPAENPNPGYGYIRKGNAFGEGFFRVERFVEKPSLEEARGLVAEGSYFWNTGIFFFRMGDFDGIGMPFFEDFLPLKGTVDAILAGYSLLPQLAFDRLVFEKSRNLLLLPCEFDWSDVGTFDSLCGLLNGENHLIRSLDSQGNLVIEKGRKLVVLIGVEGMTVVDTEDVLLLVKKGEAYKIRNLLQDLEGDDIKVLRSGLTSYRPWGYFKVLEEWERFKIKSDGLVTERCLSKISYSTVPV